jgi:hypothetical protein
MIAIIAFFSLVYIFISALWFYRNISFSKNLKNFNRKEQKILKEILREYFNSDNSDLILYNICKKYSISEKEIKTFKEKLKHFSLIEEDIPESCNISIKSKNLINLYI